MQSKYDITFDNKTLRELGLFIVKRPNIPKAVQRINNIDIPGKDGVFFEKKGYEDIRIDIEINFYTMDGFAKHCREIDEFIYAYDDNRLVFSDDKEVYYRVKNVERSDIVRIKKRIGKFTLTFTCEPYKYYEESSYEIKVKNNSEIYNYTRFNSSPVIRIIGDGLIDLRINDKLVRVNVGQNLIIDSERKLTYRVNGELQNTSISGEYPILKKGKNEISWSGGIVKELSIVPNIKTI